MENIEVMVALVVVVLIGYIAGKTGYMDETFDKRLSSLIVNITCPALIISSTMGEKLPSRDMILPLLLISTITYILLTIAAFTVPRWLTRNKDDEGVIGFAMMFGNVGFIGYPIAASIFGNEAVFYAAILNVPNTLFVFTVGTVLVAGNPNRGENPEAGWQRFRKRFNKKVLYSAPMIAAYISIVIVALGIRDVPAEISGPLTMIGNITVPGALMIIGSTMSQLSRRAMLGNATIYLTSLCRLVLVPLAFYLLFRWTAFSPLVVELNTVIIAMPVATYGTMLCLAYGKDTKLITELTFTTTLLSMFTIPLLAQFFK